MVSEVPDSDRELPSQQRSRAASHAGLAPDTVAAALDRLGGHISEFDQRLLIECPFDHYVRRLDQYPAIASYSHISPAVKEIGRIISERVGERGLERYHQGVMLTLILRSMARLQATNLPEDIKSLFADNFSRIARNIVRDADSPGFYLYPNFSKELAICTLRLIPAGVQKVELNGLPRRYFLTIRSRTLLGSLSFLAFHLGGIKPLYELHTDSRDPKAMVLFHPAGWAQFYARVARLLEMNPGVMGLFGSSWFFDPALERISPELAYLRTMVTENGGRLIYLRPCSQTSREDALMYSAKRRKAFGEGQYVPTEYLVAWPRRALIDWAGRASSMGPGPAVPRHEHSPVMSGQDGARPKERPASHPSGKEVTRG